MVLNGREKQLINYLLGMIAFEETVSGFGQQLPQLRAPDQLHACRREFLGVIFDQ